MYFIDNVKREKQRCENLIAEIEAKLIDFPPGQIYSTVSHGKPSFRIYNDGKITGIPSKNKEVLKKMAEKRLLSLKLKDEKTLAAAAERYLKAIDEKGLREQDYLRKHPEIYRILADNCMTAQERIRQWKAMPFDPHVPNPENRTLRTIDGVLVRSRAELTIANLFASNNIPYRYEDPVDVGNLTFYCDFHLLHPVTFGEFYWEHFGLMSDPEYAAIARKKIVRYTQAGYIPGQNLILTYEDEHTLLDSEWIMNLIRHYFL